MLTPDDYITLCRLCPGLLEHVAISTAQAMIESFRLGVDAAGGASGNWCIEEIMTELKDMMEERKRRAMS
jgi:hypothetical protein